MSLKLFYCYAHEDKTLRNLLEKHLANIKRQELITNWNDRNINAGQEWAREIDTNLNTADIILLLISPDFVHSDYCYSIEMKRALQRHENGTARVIPIILRPVDYDGASFSKLQSLPTDAVPITDRKWRSRDEAFLDVARGIGKAVRELLSKQWTSEGEVCFHRERYWEALEAFEQAIFFDPANILAHIGQGQTLMQILLHQDGLNNNEYYKKALAAFEQAISLDSTNALAYVEKGKVLLKLHNFDLQVRGQRGKNDILAAFNQALSLEPKNESAYIGQGDLFMVCESYEEALAAYVKALEIAVFPNRSVANRRAESLYKLDRYEEALAAFNNVILEFPKHDFAYKRKGDALYKLGRYEEALAAYEKAISLGLETTLIYTSKGNVLYQLGRFQEAIDAFDHAIRLTPIDSDNPLFFDSELVDAYNGKGNVLQTLAKEAFQKAEEFEDHPF
jgi:tetratricopeptide (TPR) repeat protein